MKFLFIILFALQIQILARADQTNGVLSSELSANDNSNENSNGDMGQATNRVSPVVPGLPVAGFDSRSCGDLAYQSMRLEKPNPPRDPCSFFHESRIYSNVHTHRLYLCDQRHTVGEYDISIGRAGFDKHLEGDKRTPLGTYALSPARLSARFGIFILIDYPTQEQIDNGYTGSAVGIHGPERPNQCNGLENVQQDWTDGCMAVTNDVFIEEIAKFVIIHPGAQITIE